MYEWELESSSFQLSTKGLISPMQHSADNQTEVADSKEQVTQGTWAGSREHDQIENMTR